MSEIKVDKLQGTSGSDTAITLSGANATVGGTLAVTGVHTIGNNAVYTSEGGSNTKNVAQGMIKAWVRTQNGGAMSPDSFGMSSVTDTAVGKYTPAMSIAMNNTNWALITGADNKNDGGNGMCFNADDAVDQTTTGYQCIFTSVTRFAITDCNQNASSAVLGDLA